MIMRKTFRKWALLGALACCLAAPMVIAGPQQDTEAAETSYRKGDYIAAIGLMRNAAQAGYAPAQVRLADILDSGDQHEEAVEWYRKAADQSSLAGEYGLGLMYLKGAGIAKDNEKARFHVLRAANQNYVPAIGMMVELYKAGAAGLPVDLAEAEKWEDKMYAVTGRSKPASKPMPSLEKKK
jgi:TPR repeat protein